jgi:hypothetical protein
MCPAVGMARVTEKNATLPRHDERDPGGWVSRTITKVKHRCRRATQAFHRKSSATLTSSRSTPLDKLAYIIPPLELPIVDLLQDEPAVELADLDIDPSKSIIDLIIPPSVSQTGEAINSPEACAHIVFWCTQTSSLSHVLGEFKRLSQSTKSFEFTAPFVSITSIVSTAMTKGDANNSIKLLIDAQSSPSVVPALPEVDMKTPPRERNLCSL